LRIEDLDGPRVKRNADTLAMDDLRWIGLDWHIGPVYQSHRVTHYVKAIKQLLSEGLAYPCICSRRESQLAASAPHSEDGSHRYPGNCRGRFESVEAARRASGKEPSIRFCVPEEIIRFSDGFAGETRVDVNALGDFVIAKGDATPAYQLAVVVDDAQMNMTDVVRGHDLLESTARQILLYRALGLAAHVPRYTHLPLVLGPDGNRLAKRHGDSRLSHYRSLGVQAGDILALLAGWCGIDDANRSMVASDLIGRFRLDSMPREPITFAKADEVGLMAGRSQ
jgi:glutamyl-tRNA synthetase